MTFLTSEAFHFSHSHAFDAETISLLLLFAQPWSKDLLVSGDGLLRFAPLLIADLAVPSLVGRQGLWPLYLVHLTVKGQRLLDAWCAGNREQVRLALTNLAVGIDEEKTEPSQSEPSSTYHIRKWRKRLAL